MLERLSSLPSADGGIVYLHQVHRASVEITAAYNEHAAISEQTGAVENARSRERGFLRPSVRRWIEHLDSRQSVLTIFAADNQDAAVLQPCGGMVFARRIERTGGFKRVGSRIVKQSNI